MIESASKPSPLGGQSRIGIRRIRDLKERGYIEEGGSAIIYRQIGRCGVPIALKVISSSNPDFIHKNEFNVLSRLNHSGIVKAYRSGKLPNGSPYHILELVVGETLDEKISQKNLTTSAALQIIYEVAGALSYLHAQGFVHCDIKPGNILVPDTKTTQGKTIGVKLCDFAWARREGVIFSVEKNTFIAGTSEYQSSEVAAKRRGPQKKDDIFALGICLLEAACKSQYPGSQPLKTTLSAHLDDHRQSLSQPVYQLISRMVALDGYERITSAQEVIDVMKTLPPELRPQLMED